MTVVPARLGSPTPPRRRRFRFVLVVFRPPSFPETFTPRVHPRPPTELAPDQRSAFRSPRSARADLPDGGLAIAVRPPSRVTGLLRDLKPRCPLRSRLLSCDNLPGVTGVPSPLSSVRDVLTSSTVCSTSILGRPFRADHRVRDSPFRGLYLSHSAARFVTRRVPSCRSSPQPACACAPAPATRASPSGRCSVRESVVHRQGFSPPANPIPSWSCLPSGFAPRTVKTRLRSRTLSVHSLETALANDL